MTTAGTSLGGSLFGNKTTAPTLTFGTPAVTTSAFSFGTPKTTATTGMSFKAYKCWLFKVVHLVQIKSMSS